MTYIKKISIYFQLTKQVSFSYVNWLELLSPLRSDKIYPRVLLFWEVLFLINRLTYHQSLSTFCRHVAQYHLSCNLSMLSTVALWLENVLICCSGESLSSFPSTDLPISLQILVNLYLTLSFYSKLPFFLTSQVRRRFLPEWPMY